MGRWREIIGACPARSASLPGVMWGDMERCGEMEGDHRRMPGALCIPARVMWGDMERCGEMEGDHRRMPGALCIPARGDVGRHGEMWGDGGRS